MRPNGRLDHLTQALLVTASRLVAEGRAVDAIEPLRQAVARDPANAAVHHDLGFVYLQCARPAEAAIAFEAALAADPCFALAYLRLGMARQALGDEAAALQAYHHAIALQPSLAEAWHRAGAMLESHGRQAEANAAFHAAADAAPLTSLGRLSRARVSLAEGRDAEAEQLLHQALALEPDYIPAIDLLGSVHAEAGRLDEARACYERSTAASPHWAGSYYELVRCRRITPDDASLVASMRAALELPGQHPELCQKVQLALGKAAADLGDYGEAMRHFDAADSQRNRLAKVDLAAIEARVNRMIAHFTAERLAAATAVRDDQSPVLIVGLPRSGTTLVEQILSSHPDVHAGGELGFWTGHGARWEQLCGDTSCFLEDTASNYLSLLRNISPTAARVTDKMPLNVFWVGLVRLCLPGSTIVLVRREPVATALSIHQTYFNPHVALPTGGAALVATIRAVERLSDHWRAVLPPEHVIEIRYEHLVNEPETTIRTLLAGCGLSWNDACLRPQDNTRIVKTPSKWQVRQPISRHSEESWRRYKPWLGAFSALVTQHDAEVTS